MNNLEPEVIKNHLFSRLDKTKKINDELSSKLNLADDLDISSTIYFKYYFDFSTAIEMINRHILIKKYGEDKYITKKERFDCESVPFFIEEEKEKCLVEVEGGNVTFNEIKKFYSNHITMISDDFYSRISIDKTIDNYDSFINCYKEARFTRNRIAHGLLLLGVKYDNDTLFKFMITFYCLYKYYEKLFVE